MATGCHLNSALRHQKGTTFWCSARQNWGTERVLCGPQRAEEMSQKKLRRNSRSFSTRPVYRDSQLKIGWTEQKCIEMDKLAQEDHSYRPSSDEFQRYQKHWYLTLNTSGKNAPMQLRSDFRAAVAIMNRLHRESGEERAEPFLFQQYQRWHPSSSSDSWWDWDTSKRWWSSWVQFIF